MALSEFHLQLYLLHVGLVGLRHFTDIVRALTLHRGEPRKCQPHHMVNQVSKTSVSNLNCQFYIQAIQEYNKLLKNRLSSFGMPYNVVPLWHPN